jgi:hypothetical protein
VAVSITASRERSRILTKRGLYFFILWIVPLVVDWGTWYGYVVHVPFALVHSFNARRKSTPELLRASWRVPVKVAAWTLLHGVGFELYDTWRVHRWSDLALPGRWAELSTYVAIAFGVSFAHLCLGWLLLITVAHRWRLDNRVTEEARARGA